jgi:hypothetical protein
MDTGDTSMSDFGGLKKLDGHIEEGPIGFVHKKYIICRCYIYIDSRFDNGREAEIARADG